MLGALDDSRRVQRQLIEDASHELRTPLTSLRTNIEVLATERTLPPGERARLLSDVVEQLQEISLLVGDSSRLRAGSSMGSSPRTSASTWSRRRHSTGHGATAPA